MSANSSNIQYYYCYLIDSLASLFFLDLRKQGIFFAGVASEKYSQKLLMRLQALTQFPSFL